MEFFWETAKNAWAQYNYSKRLEENLAILKTKMRGLSSQACDIKNELKREEVVHGRKIKEEVSLWLKNVEKITSEAMKVEEDSREVRRYFSLSRVAFGKLVIEKIEEVVKLKEKGQFSEGLLADLVPESGSMPMMKLVGRTRDERNMEEIWESLMDRVVKIIGVYGMAGVGKTTIMTQIHNRITRSGTFGHAIWVQPPKDSNIERLQDGIGQAIALDLSHEEDEMRRSVKLLEALKWRENNFVIIFDEVYKSFPLEKVGIPKGDTCKIVLTTRSKNVCRDMKCDRKIEVEVLSREEAWKLFKERLGADVVLSMEVEPIAKLITEECGGLPLGIITIANAMREKNDVREWRKALEELKCSTMEMEGMDDQVFRMLKFSYNRIKSERSRSCFLYCALFEEGYGIYDEGLIEYWVAEGLIDDMGDWEKELDKGHTILKELIDLGLLVSFEYHSLLMHDLVIDLAIGITRKNPRFVVKVGTGIRGSIGVEEFTEDVERISLMRNEIEMLSGEPNCPKLSTLLLKMNPLSGNISHEFFNHMKSLRVLDLSITEIEYLPASVSNLENLRVLLLENCRMLREVPSLEKLKHVKLLNLSATDIKELPHGMECLVNLKELCVSSSTTNRLNAVGCNSLVLPGTIVKLEMSQCDLSSLPYLSPLRRLQKCSISWCSMKWLLPIRDNSTITSLPSIQSLSLQELPSFRGLCEGVLLPGSFACLGRLLVDRCNVLESLMSVAMFQHLQCLEHIEIKNCSEMEEVIRGEEAMVEESDNNNNNNTILLPRLKELYLHRLGKLKSICERVLTCPSLNKIHIVGCHRLKKIPLSLGHSTSVVVGEIEGSRERWDALEWDDSNTKTLLLPLFKQVEEAAGGGGEARGIKRKAEELQQVAWIS